MKHSKPYTRALTSLRLTRKDVKHTKKYSLEKIMEMYNIDNMNKDLLKIMGILLISFFIIYLVIHTFKIKTVEGLENNADTSVNGEAGNAANFAAQIKAKTVQLQDSLLIQKYRQDYENIIINMDDYFSMLMLKTVLNLEETGDGKQIAALNALSTAKKTLNEIMAFVDKQ